MDHRVPNESWRIRWSVTASGHSYSGPYHSLRTAEKQIGALREEWGDQITLMDLERYEDEELVEITYLG